MGKLKDTLLIQLNTKQGAAAPVAQEHLPATGRARPKKPRLPHQKHGGGFPPVNNMGETLGCGSAKAHDIAKMQNVELVMSDGQVKIMPTRIPAVGHCAVIDWVNLTVHQDTFLATSGECLFDAQDYVIEASRLCHKIFGFGVTAEYGKILNFYKNSWVLGDGFGFVCYGGQRDTLMIVLNGSGCLHAAEGWERRLYQFLTTTAKRPQLTRIDLAHDDFESKFITPQWAEAQWVEGNMSLCANAPNIEKRGNWHRPNGRGRTLYIGSRESGKYARFYDKGKKEGDKESLWTRAEIELKSSDRLIPLDILLTPSDYFLGAYPCLAFLKSEITTPERIKVKQKAASITFERSVEILKTQMGAYITFLRNYFNDDDKFLAKISHPDPEIVPKRLKQTLKDLNTCGKFAHELERLKLSALAAISKPILEVDWSLVDGRPTLTGGQWDLAF
jgi:phage replication initiation protein